MNNDMMMMMMQLMPLMSSFSSGSVTFSDVIEGRGAGSAIRAQLLNFLPGTQADKNHLLNVLQQAASLAKQRRVTVLDVLIGSNANHELADELKKGLKKL